MRVVELRAENVKRLKAVEIRPEGDVVVVAGANAQGKSSVLDSIWLALGGRDATKDVPEPVRQGETSASVTLDLGDLIVERQWNAGGKTNLIVKARDGARYSSPQKVLDELIGKLTFDPLAFTQMDRRKQLETLMSVIDLPFDPDELAEQRAAVYAARADANRDAKQLRARLDSMPSYPPGTPTEPVDVAAVVARRDEIHDREQHVLRLREEHRQLVEEQQRIEASLHHVMEAGRYALARLAELTDEPAPEIMRLNDQIANATSLNEAVAGWRNRVEVESQLEATTAIAIRRSDEIQRIDDAKVAGVAAANMPVPGLSFDDEGVTLNGVPFSQASGAEQLKVAVAIAIAANPKIRVLRITDGSLLDRSNMALLEQLCAAHDFQVWVERVDESGEVGVVIEDGMVKA